MNDTIAPGPEPEAPAPDGRTLLQETPVRVTLTPPVPGRRPSDPDDAAPVFVDASGRRRRLVRQAGVACGGLLALFLVAMGVSVATGADVPFTPWSSQQNEADGGKRKNPPLLKHHPGSVPTGDPRLPGAPPAPRGDGSGPSPTAPPSTRPSAPAPRPSGRPSGRPSQRPTSAPTSAVPTVPGEPLPTPTRPGRGNGNGNGNGKNKWW
ncbi:hypothetical protein [Actinomadura kijaniata]|uniref:hypothetical protein n=1 Tax=Actinomadura kijaniata TaxID=46161 RepID=UPI00082D6591|nr:hypothetical protein [Actinomadura kijaniata]